MRSILAVIKKELRSIFTNKTILAQIILVPFIYVFGFTMLMGGMSPTEEPTDVDVKGYYINIDGTIAEGLVDLGLKKAELSQLNGLKDKVKKGDADVVVVFPDNFLAFESQSLPDVNIYYDSSNEDSYKGFVMVSSVLDSLNPKYFTINVNESNTYDLMDEGATLKEMLALILPTYVLIAVIIASQALAAESIAGDKERGFLNMMLLAPVKRYTIAVGKSLSLVIVNVISTISAFIAVALSLPKFSEMLSISTVITYTPLDYINFFLLTITATTLLLSLMLLASTLANGVKQASSASAAVMILVMLISMLLGSGNDIAENVLELGTLNAYIPVWNTVVGMQFIFKQTLTTDMILISCIVNIVATVTILCLIAKMFGSEKIVNNTNT